MKKIVILLVALVAIFFFLGRDLNPLDLHLFTMHDSTQAARMQEFALNLQSGIIPPRLAPNFSFQHGFPVFNFYAPFTYWIGGILHLIGFSSALALKLVLFFGLLASFISFFLFASVFFNVWGALLGAVVYSSSLWMAVEIFVRGNVGEIWFMALFPLGLYFLKKNDAESKPIFFLLSCITLSFLFTVHNILSLVSVVFVILFSFTLTQRKKALISILFGLLLGTYFLLPAVFESNLTYASEIASRTKYTDHFLCAWQLWKADNWSFGGSGVGCFKDDMSFQIGKLHILLSVLGLGIFLILFFRDKKKKLLTLPVLILTWTLFCAFLTIYASRPFWDLFAPFMAVFQFPWRFLPFVVFGVAYFSSFSPDLLKNERVSLGISLIASFVLLYSSSKFFSKPWKLTLNEYTSSTISKKYIETRAAYEIPEYFPRVGEYKTWRSYDSSERGFYSNILFYEINMPFYKKITTNLEQATLPIHYFPFWEVYINGKREVPTQFDALGRPIIMSLVVPSTIAIRYNETPIEKTADSITVISFIALIVVITNKKLWKKANNILK